MKKVEQKLIDCNMCNRITTHQRNTSQSSGFMVLVHLILTICTFGIWLLIIGFIKLCSVKVGGWTCSECGG